jgi:hypothetical protein
MDELEKEALWTAAQLKHAAARLDGRHDDTEAAERFKQRAEEFERFFDGHVCHVCGEEIPDEYDKFDSKAPVWDELIGTVHHLDCEHAVFEEVRAEVE